MSGKNINFDDKKIKRSSFYNSIPEDNIIPLCIKLPQMTGYARKFNENSTMSFIVKDKKLLKNIVKYGKQLKG